MKTTLTAIAASLALLTVACNAQSPTEPVAETPVAPITQPAEQVAPAATAAATPAAPQLQADMRAVWQGHIEKTRAYAMAAATTVPPGHMQKL